MNKRLARKIANAKDTSDRLRGSDLLNLRYLDLKKLIATCISNYRKRRPLNEDYRSLVKFYEKNNAVEHKIVGYIKNKSYLQELVDYVYNSNHIKANFKEKTVDEFLKKCFIEYFDGCKIPIDDIIKKIKDKFEKLHEWIFIFPLKNIKLEIPYFKLGEYKLINFNQYQKKKQEEIIKFHFRDSIDQLNFAIRMFNLDWNRFLKDRVCARIVVETGDSKTATEKAEEELSLFMNCIKYISTRWYPTFNKYRILSQEESYLDWSATIGHSKTGGTAGHMSNKNPSPFVFARHNTNQMLSLGSNKLHSLLKMKKKCTDFQKFILHGMNLFGDACVDSHDASAYVKFTTVLEYLLVNEHESISHNLSERIAFLFSNLPERRKGIYIFIKQMYKIRCSIVHSGTKFVDSGNLKSIRNIAYNVLLIMINTHNNIETKQDFLDVIESKKFGKKIALYKNQLIIGF